MNLETRQAYCEVDKILELISNDMSNKIPVKLKEFFKREMDKNYIPKIDINKPIKEQNLKRKTIIIISNLNLQYWCKDENKKQELLRQYSNNNRKHQEELREKYNPDNMFKNRQSNEVSKEIQNLPVEKKNENIFNIVINKIKKFFGKF